MYIHVYNIHVYIFVYVDIYLFTEIYIVFKSLVFKTSDILGTM